MEFRYGLFQVLTYCKFPDFNATEKFYEDN